MTEKGNKSLELPIGGAGINDKLLVIGHDTEFSDYLMDYSLRMAARLDYSIVALNLLTVAGRKRNYAKSKAGNLELEELMKHCRGAAESFGEKALGAGVEFTHLARTGDFDDVVQDICKERGDIDLVLMEPEYVNQDSEGPISIPAFYMIPEA